jgi:hypothetical protein
MDYDPETGWLTWRARDKEFFAHETAWKIWHKRYPGTRALATDNGQGYGSGSLLGYRFAAHRVVWAHYHGKWPDGSIDHINQVRDDNRIANLRDVHQDENARNQKRFVTNRSGHTGVYQQARNKRWYAHIGVNGERLGLGSYKNKVDAVAARKAAEIKYNYHENHGKAA